METEFWNKVEKQGDCLIWTGAGHGKHGYGSTRFNGKKIDTHRLAYMFAHGEIPQGALICHSCDVKLCVNPEHLFAGTYYDNWIDAVDKGIITPVSNDRAKLSFVLANEIRSKYRPGVYGQKKLAKEYGVSHTSIQDILHGRVYKH